MESATTTRAQRARRPWTPRRWPRRSRPRPQQYADRPAIRTKGDEQSYTWGEYAQKVEELARGLAALGLERGQAMGSMLTNRPEFHFFDTAAMHLGATPFSAYNTYTVDQVTYLIQDSEAKIMVTEKAFLDTILAVRDADTPLETVIVVDGDGENDTLTVAEVIEGGDSGFDFEGAWKGVDPDDVLTLIYTSGTTGPPKGVQLTHDNIVFAIGGIEDIIQFPDGGRVISWLPYAHIAERQCSQYLPMVMGFTTTDCPDPRQVMAYMPEVRPTWFFAVPRIWEKLKAGLEAMVAGEQDEQKKAGLEKAFEVGLKKVKLEQAGEPVPEELAAAYARARREGPVQDPRDAGLRPDRGRERGRGAHARRGAGVLPRHRHPRGRAVGHVRDLRRRRGEPAGQDQDRLRGPAHARLRDQAGRRRRGHGQEPVRDEGLPQPARQDRRDADRRRLAAHRRHRRVRRGRLPEAGGPQEGADHQRRGQEHEPGQHRGAREVLELR